jgi:hypothetical protein
MTDEETTMTALLRSTELAEIYRVDIVSASRFTEISFVVA